MKNITDADFQKLLQIALQSLSIQQTLLENQAAELNEELRTLERDEALEKIDRSLLLIQQDYQHYQAMLDPSLGVKIENYYD